MSPSFFLRGERFRVSGILPLPGFVEGGQGIVLYLEYSDDADHEYDILFI